MKKLTTHHSPLTTQKGQIGIALLGIFSFIFVLAAVIFTSTNLELTSSRNTYERVKALEAAEGGVNFTIYKIKEGLIVQAVPPDITLPPNPTCYKSTDFSLNYNGAEFTSCWFVKSLIPGGNISAVQVRIVSDGYVPKAPDPLIPGDENRITRRVETEIVISTSLEQIIFAESVITDRGGVETDGNGEMTGPVFSNGPIRLGKDINEVTLLEVADTATTTNLTEPYHLEGASSCSFTTVLGLITGRMNGCVKIGTNITFPATVRAKTIQGTYVEGPVMNCTPHPIISGKFGAAPNTCDPPDPPGIAERPSPVSDSLINSWQNQAANGGTQLGFNCNSHIKLGPKEILGNLNLRAGCILEMTGSLWVTGNVDATSNAQLVMDCDVYGPNGVGVLVVDGKISTTATTTMGATDLDPDPLDPCAGTTTSYILAVSKFNNQSLTPATGTNAGIVSAGSSSNVILVAKNSWINLSGSTGTNVAAAWGVRVTGGGKVTFKGPLVINSTGPVTVGIAVILYHDCRTPKIPGPDPACPPTLLGP